MCPFCLYSQLSKYLLQLLFWTISPVYQFIFVIFFFIFPFLLIILFFIFIVSTFIVIIFVRWLVWKVYAFICLLKRFMTTKLITLDLILSFIIFVILIAFSLLFVFSLFFKNHFILLILSFSFVKLILMLILTITIEVYIIKMTIFYDPFLKVLLIFDF